MNKVGFLGLGMMGHGMARSLLRDGYNTAVWNRSIGKAQDLIQLGAREATTPADAVEDAEIVISMVADDAASERCWLAEDGAMDVLAPGAFVVECSTISHEHSRRLAAEAVKRGLRYIDCPVNGPPSAAAKGELILLVGADPADLRDARPVLEAISSSILHFGPTGTGTAYKLLNNLLGAIHVAATAEAANVARTLGLDVDTMVTAIETGPVASPHTKRMIRPMLEGRPADSFGLAIGLREKDSRYCLGMAEALNLSMSVGTEAHKWYRAASRTVGSEDDSSMLKIIAEYSGAAPDTD